MPRSHIDNIFKLIKKSRSQLVVFRATEEWSYILRYFNEAYTMDTSTKFKNLSTRSASDINTHL